MTLKYKIRRRLGPLVAMVEDNSKRVITTLPNFKRQKRCDEFIKHFMPLGF